MPQMMPLPWVFVFVVLFFCFYSFVLYFSLCFGVSTSVDKLAKSSNIVISW